MYIVISFKETGIKYTRWMFAMEEYVGLSFSSQVKSSNPNSIA